MQGVLSGSHYNRGWIVHNTFAEGLERIFLSRFINETNPDIPQSLWDLAADPKPEVLSQMNEFHQLSEKYEKYKEDCRKGKLEETAKFWLTYLDLMHFQNMIRLAVQENNIDMLIDSWKYFLPWYFALNKTNYARYGSYYYNNLVNMEQLYSGLKHLVKDSGMYKHKKASPQEPQSTNEGNKQLIKI